MLGLVVFLILLVLVLGVAGYFLDLGGPRRKDGA